MDDQYGFYLSPLSLHRESTRFRLLVSSVTYWALYAELGGFCGQLERGCRAVQGLYGQRDYWATFDSDLRAAYEGGSAARDDGRGTRQLFWRYYHRAHRLAHELHKLRTPLIARMIS